MENKEFKLLRYPGYNVLIDYPIDSARLNNKYQIQEKLDFVIIRLFLKKWKNNPIIYCCLPRFNDNYGIFIQTETFIDSFDKSLFVEDTISEEQLYIKLRGAIRKFFAITKKYYMCHVSPPAEYIFSIELIYYFIINFINPEVYIHTKFDEIEYKVIKCRNFLKYSLNS